jgi:hypothetical protein
MTNHCLGHPTSRGIVSFVSICAPGEVSAKIFTHEGGLTILSEYEQNNEVVRRLRQDACEKRCRTLALYIFLLTKLTIQRYERVKTTLFAGHEFRGRVMQLPVAGASQQGKMQG